MIHDSVFDGQQAPSDLGPAQVRLRNGMMKRGKPLALAAWLFSSDDEDALESIANMYGGTVEPFDSDREPLSVLTRATTIPITMKPGSINTGFVVWDGGKLLRRCNGETVIEGEGAGERCACAGLTWAERKDGPCKADVCIRYTLTDAPDLVDGIYRSANLNFLKDVQRAEARVQDAEEPVRATLNLEEVRTNAGRVFSKVVLKFVK